MADIQAGKAGRTDGAAAKEERRAQAAKHSALMKGAFASDTQAAADAVTIYEDGEGRALAVPEAAFEQTETQVTSAFAPEALYRFATGKTLVVDPASFTRPGGAYEDGAFGPEQILCSESNLYQVLCAIKHVYHDANREYRRGQLFTDRAAYLPGVVFSHAGTMRKADVLVVAEPLRARAIENHRSERECDQALADRIEAILRIAAANECETLVCGAFGSGRLGAPAQQVADLFKAWLDAHPGVLRRVVFAVPRACFDVFDETFGAPNEEVAPVSPTRAEDEDADGEDGFDLSKVELPEGVTLR